jgi:hypothetical protein
MWEKRERGPEKVGVGGAGDGAGGNEKRKEGNEEDAQE